MKQLLTNNLEYLPSNQHKTLMAKSHNIGKMISGLIKYLKGNLK